jgi:hypothetical protein
VKQVKVDASPSYAAARLPSLVNPAHAAAATIAEYNAAFASATPFPHLRLRDFFKDPTFLDALKAELLALDFVEKVTFAVIGAAPQGPLANLMCRCVSLFSRRAMTCINSVNPTT